MHEQRIDWPQGEKVAVSIVVNVEEGSEMSIKEGDRGMEPVDELGIYIKTPIRNYGNESNYRYGLTAGAPRVLGLLDKHGVPATWTAAALALERAPDLARAIAARGDEPCSHGWRWVHQFKLDEDGERDFIRRAADSIERTTGTRPAGWLSRYFHTDNTRRLLIEEGFRYHMDDYSGDVPFWDAQTVPDKPIVIVPYQLDANDMKMWTDPAYTPQMWLDYAVRTFDTLYAEGAAGAPKMMSLGLHLRIIGRPGRIWALDEFLGHITAKPGVWVATRLAIAEHFAGQEPVPA